MTRPTDDLYLQGVFDTLVAIRQHVEGAIADGELGPMPIATMIAMVESLERDLCEGVTVEQLIELAEEGG